MFSLNYISQWLMTCVTVERALAVTLPTQSSSLRTFKSAGILTGFLSVFVFSTTYVHIDQNKLVSHPDDPYPWCINEIRPNQEQLIQYISLTHQISPFLINMVAGLVIIFGVSRSKAISQHISKRTTLAKQARQRFDLLLGPIICFITQLPQLIILFLNACDYNQNSWFAHLTLLAYYISFLPQLRVFSLYLLPSPLFKEVLLTQTMVGKRFCAVKRSRLVTQDIN
jgi:hypothetical protein